MANNIQVRFEEYHKNNPHVYDMFVKFAKEAKKSNRKKYSAKSIFERMRWHTEIETQGEPFKLSNNYTAYYARKVMEELPEFDGFFRTKELRSQ